MIKVVLWDIDGTLLDFKKAESRGIKQCFSDFNIGVCTDEMIARYSEINHKCWVKLESGELTKAEVLTKRFEEFFENEGIGFNRIDELNARYQQYLGDFVFFTDHALETVKAFKGRVKQYAVTNGTAVAQHKKLKNSGLDDLLDGVFISDEVGADKPSKAFFDRVFEKIGRYAGDEVMIVGDSLTSDMQGANNAKILACFYDPQIKSPKTQLKIDFIIHNISEVEKIIANFNKM